MKLTFLGANHQVTGSCYLLEASGRRVLIDCGMFQERRYRDRNRQPWAFDPTQLDAVVLTHAHLDHCGLLPRLVRDGFSGPIFTHHASADLAMLVMADSGRLQERQEDDERDDYMPDEPLYTAADADRVRPRFHTLGYGVEQTIADGISMTLHEAGHILGSASIALRAEGKTIVFSGDLGQYAKPLIRDPDPPAGADLLILESTYGDTQHGVWSAKYGDEDQPSPKDDRIEDQLESIITDTQQRGGKLVIPTFAVERAQELLYYLARLRDAKRFAHLPVFLDSPMAVEVTRIFKRHKDLLDPQSMEELLKDGHVLGFEGLHLCETRKESFAINDLRGPAIILAGSGMCTGGRVLHHLVRYLDNRDATVLFVGYQAHDTLGRQLLEGRNPVRVLGWEKPVRARIAQMTGLSGHGDRPALLRWIGSFDALPQRICLTHGEDGPAHALARRLRDELRIDVQIPDYQSALEL